MGEADRALFRLINGAAGDLPPLDWAMARLANDYLVPVALSLALLALWFSPQAVREARQRGVMGAALALLLTSGGIKLLNLLYFRPRPFQEQEMEVNLLFYRPTDPSFPSNMAAVACAIAASIFLVDRRLGLLFGLPVLLVSLARVYVGVHYPADVLGGWALGTLMAYLAWRLLNWQQAIPRFILELGRRFYLA